MNLASSDWGFSLSYILLFTGIAFNIFCQVVLQGSVDNTKLQHILTFLSPLTVYLFLSFDIMYTVHVSTECVVL